MDKDTEKVLKALREQGFETRTTTRGHVRVFGPDGKYVTTFAGTGSDWRGIKNGIAQARRAGFRWPP